jgi:hypothetical protein
VSRPEETGGLWRALGSAFRVRFGGGAVGRLGQITIFGGALIVILAIAIVMRVPTMAPILFGGLVFFLVFGLTAALIYCLRFPQFAALGDAQMERVMKHDQAAKGLDPTLLPRALEAPTDNPLLLADRSTTEGG